MKEIYENMLSTIEIMLIVSDKICILSGGIMKNQIKHINIVIRRLKTNNIANIQYVDRLNNDTLFYDFTRGRHIDIDKLFSLYERIEENYD